MSAFAGALAIAACSGAPEGTSAELQPNEVEKAEPFDPFDPFDAPPPEGDAYFSLRVDRRPCPAPLCQGYWVKRVNTSRTYCANGQWSQSCYVAHVELDAIGLTPADETTLRSDPARLLVRGRIATREFAGTGTLGVFRANEAWRAPAGVRASQGTFYKVEKHGVEMMAQKLNSSSYPQKLGGVDLASAPGTAADKDDALARLGRNGLVVTGPDEVVETDDRLDAADFFALVRGAEGHQ